MGTMIDRRRVMGKKNTPYLPDYTLIHHWEAADGIVNDGWVDRIQGKVLTAYGNPQLVDGMFKLKYADTYFLGNLNSYTPINMGDVWQVDIEFIIDKIPTDTSIWIADFGSQQNSPHAFGFSIGTTGTTSFNPKLTGNNSSSLYNVAIPFTTLGILSKLSMGMEKISNDTYLPYYVCNGVRWNSPNTVNELGATFNANFDKPFLFVGRGYHVSATDWKYVKSIKIYKKVQA